MTEFIEVIGSQQTRPDEIDTTSSAYYVYERKDIQKYEEKDEEENVLFTGWKYLERKIPREQWLIETAAQNKISNEAIMAGMVDLYELQLEGLGE